MSHTAIEQKRKVVTNFNLVPPALYNVIYLDDDHTSVAFVVASLVLVFKHDKASAETLTRKINDEGSAIVATLPFEIAEQKCAEVITVAQKEGLPLQIKLAKE